MHRLSAAREQLIAIDQIEQRHRLLARRMDDVMVVDDVPVLTAGAGGGRPRKQLPDQRTTDYEEARVTLSGGFILRRSIASDRRKVRSRVEPRKQSSRSS